MTGACPTFSLAPDVLLTAKLVIDLGAHSCSPGPVATIWPLPMPDSSTRGAAVRLLGGCIDICAETYAASKGMTMGMTT